MNTIRQHIAPGLRGALFYAFYWGAVGLYEPFLNVYFMRIGLDSTQIGWLAAVLPLCTLAVAPLVARMADRARRRVLFLALGSGGFALAIMLPLAPGFRPTFAAMVGFVGLFAVFRSPIVALADSLTASMAQRHALDFGAMRLWGSIAYTITAICLGLVWARTGFSTMFFCTGLGFVLVILAALLLEEPAPQVPNVSSREAHPLVELAHEKQPAPARWSLDPGLLFLLSATFLVIAALFMAGTFGSVYMVQLGGSEGLVGALMGISALGEVPGMLVGSRVARRFGYTNTLLVAYVLNAAGLFGYGLAQTPNVMLIFSALRGLGFGLLLVCTVTIINLRAPHHLAATYQGILNASCWGLAPLLGGPISGWIYQNLGPSTLFFTAAGMVLTATILITPTYKIWKRKERLEVVGEQPGV